MEARGVRIGWHDLPAHVTRAVEAVLGARVVSAESQPGGFSPGTADRVVTADGRRAFVKAVSPAQNGFSPTLHRAEIGVAAALPPTAPAPRLLGSYDDGDWVALVLEDVAGRHPATPWLPDELDRVLTATRELARALTPTPRPDLPSAVDLVAEGMDGWRRIRAERPDHLDDWCAAHLDDLCDLEAYARAALAGETLVHGDLRADNMLLREDGGGVVFVDWPWACNGAPWIDTLVVLVNVAFYGGHDVEALVRRECPGVDPQVVTAVLAGFTGFLLEHARRAPPPGLPTIRAFQAAQAATTLAWVRRRLDCSATPTLEP